MTTEQEIIVVADDWDHPASRMLIDELWKNYSVKAKIWRSDYFIKNEHEVSNTEVFITVGGFNYNDVTKKYLRLIENIIYEDNEIFVGLGFHKAFVWGKQEWESTEKAVRYFIDNNLKRFVEKDTQPDPTPPEPDPAPEVEVPGTIGESKEEYIESTEPENEFYQRKDGDWFIRYYDEETTVSETRGVLYIHHLLKNPRQPYYISKLWCDINGGDAEILARECGELKTKSKSKDDKKDGDANFKKDKMDYKEARELKEFKSAKKIRKQNLINRIESIKTEKNHYQNLYTSVLVDNNYKPEEHRDITKEEKLDDLQKSINRKEKERKEWQAKFKQEFPSKNEIRNGYRQKILKARVAFYKKLEKKNMSKLVKYLKDNIKTDRGYIFSPKNINDIWILSKD